MPISRALFPNLKNHKLDTVAKHLKLADFHHHRACDDARILAEIFLRGMPKSCRRKQQITAVDQINTGITVVDAKKLPPYHICILVQEPTPASRISTSSSPWSHLNYFYKQSPHAQERALQAPGGTAAWAAPVKRASCSEAIVDGKSFNELCEIAKFYDYLEIQPIGQQYVPATAMARSKSMEQLRDINRTIVKLGEKLHKPVVATGDVHFLEPEDAKFREILMAGQGFKDADRAGAALSARPPRRCWRSSAYLGEEKAYEVVVENTNKIADMHREDPAHPRWHLYRRTLRGRRRSFSDITWDRAKEIYGDPVPEIVPGPPGPGADLHHQARFRGAVHHRPEAGVRVGGATATWSAPEARSAPPLWPSWRGSRRSIRWRPTMSAPTASTASFSPTVRCGSGFDLPAKNCPALRRRR